MFFSIIQLTVSFSIDLSVPSDYKLYMYINFAFVTFLGYFSWNVVEACELKYRWSFSIVFFCLVLYQYYIPKIINVKDTQDIFIWNFWVSLFDYTLLRMEQLQPSPLLAPLPHEPLPQHGNRFVQQQFRQFNCSPLLSIRDAMFTVSPKRQYRGALSPTTAAATGPVWKPRRH
ncbi:hypothetical protein GCK72_014808 [Caenorhabditis remanei]|uniref:Uncharacterized protein n=1 Tax=Caenorhabditis remanei TaxID=31234 RepID=A0A6A5GSF2_CAERE|nr:hypothetical protein GCK72_014808 [Caenorhabditis remanei]KAF1758350.1 hypothetical protein GCK72_014808 [Caenorhabditis remanei]